MYNKSLNDIHKLWRMGQALKTVEDVNNDSMRTAAYIAADIATEDFHRLDEEARLVENIRRSLFHKTDEGKTP